MSWMFGRAAHSVEGMSVSTPLCDHAAASGPVVLRALRHGESTSNVAWAEALAGSTAIVPSDDMKISLTDRGRRQAAAVGRWLSALDQPPDMVWCSPYLRAEQTWSLARRELVAAGREAPCERVDDRLRDRHRGLLHHLPPAVVEERFPGEAAREGREGMLGYRPPDGESFMDVAARLRSAWQDIRGDAAHQRVLIVAHDAVVLLLRQILEGLSDDEILAITAGGLAGNGSVTTWERQDKRFRLASYDFRGHLRP
ncbi:phosphoglycerate mutase [Planotetraspora mira]|uniref:phosphoglycerate mutase (2,3-diphosphoglycerate-dependent) n=2 Tax=Planotetraspora mira TaxID=58121 RepID=A0A8J3TS45_9ACTN|nr:phosphoglycerate mutase [Planotetraspora mira]